MDRKLKSLLVVGLVVVLCGYESSNVSAAENSVDLPAVSIPPMGTGPTGDAPAGKGLSGLEVQVPQANTSWILHKHLDLPYASQSSTQKLDIYLPNQGTGPFPVIFYVHGGGFAFGSKSDSLLDPELQGLFRGYAVVAVDYRLSKEAKWPSQVYDVKAALRYVKAHAAEYQLDADHIVAWGGSAGGYLVTMLAASADVPSLEDKSMGNAEESTKIQGAVDCYGLNDFSKLDGYLQESNIPLPGPHAGGHNAVDSFESTLMGAPILTIPEKVQQANPLNYITPDCAPMLIQHSKTDEQAPWQGSRDLADKLSVVVGKRKVTFELLPNLKHADAGYNTDENVSHILDWIDKILKK